MERIADLQRFCAAYAKARFSLSRDEEGASLVEYALLVALIAVVCITAITFLGGKASGKLSAAGKSLS